MEPKFSFPFQPYAIQEKFMKELYFTVENSQPGIFESPTGTGKSLSICCGVLQWYNDHNKKLIEDLEREIQILKAEIAESSETDDWLQEEYKKVQSKQKLANLQIKLERIKKKNAFYNEMKTRVAKQKANMSKKTEYLEKKRKDENKENSFDEQVEDTDLIIDEVINDDEKSDDDGDDVDEEENSVKVFISSRTHSQLSQFIGEIKRTIFKDDTRVVTLASRQHYCINSDVNRLKNINLINERCLDLQKSKSKSSSVSDEGKVLKKTKTKSCGSCQYYNQTNIGKLKDQLLVEILDMEDLVKAGKELKACPYYASRMALQDAQLVLLCHAGVVSSGARAGVSLKLKNNILILDEAHGLTAALENAHSAPVSYKQLSTVKTYLQFYVNKYRARLSSKSLLSLNQLLFVVGRFLAMITQKPEPDVKTEDETTIYTLEDFVIKAEIDNLNLRPLVEFARNSKLAPKLHGFSMKYNQQILEEAMKEKSKGKKTTFESFLSNIAKKKMDEVNEVAETEVKISQPPQESSAGSGLYAALDLMERLCDRSANGRILAQRSATSSGSLKYLLLNPNEHFVDVVKQCRAVIVAGGTMEPISEFKSLLTGDSGSDVTVLRCGHVVPKENVLAICLSKGPSSRTLNFSYENRNSGELLDEIGRILRNLCSIIPGGIVCFFPSYSYEQSVFEHLKTSKVIESIEKKKRVFREPKSAAAVDQVLHKYAEAVRAKHQGNNGALLLSVVGGKLSEGLNFSDDLGRCVLVIGLPYPNLKSPELQEKMAYLNKAEAGQGAAYYEGLCMKAVNQCIGRAVRHAQDYACVVLVDERYSRPQTIAALPSFVQNSLLPNSNFGPTIGNIAKFFSKHKNKL